jgi:hypothetical protein
MPGKSKSKSMNAVKSMLKAQHPHRIPNPPNAIPEINTTPWQALRARIALTPGTLINVDLVGVKRALFGTTSGVVELRILRIYVYLRNQSTSSPGASSSLTPLDFIRTPSGLSLNQFGRFERFSTPTSNAAIGFDYGITIGSTVNRVVDPAASATIATVNGSDCYVDVLARRLPTNTGFQLTDEPATSPAVPSDGEPAFLDAQGLGENYARNSGYCAIQ